MKISEAGLEFIRQKEGIRLIAYPDPGTGGKPWTLGVGHTRGVQEGDTCTEEQAMEWLRDDVEWCENCINGYVDVELSQNQFDALASFIFNIGCTAFRGSSLLRLLNAHNPAAAAQQFLRWDRAGGHVMAGLTARRQAEMEMFQA